MKDLLTVDGDGDDSILGSEEQTMNYAIELDGKVYLPDGVTTSIAPSEVDTYNKGVEQREIAWLKTAPERLFLYVEHPSEPPENPTQNQLQDHAHGWKITTGLGTSIATYVGVGPRVKSGFGYHTYRRSVSCRIFGVQYHGWYYESSGSYCRLKKAKRQPKAL